MIKFSCLIRTTGTFFFTTRLISTKTRSPAMTVTSPLSEDLWMIYSWKLTLLVETISSFQAMRHPQPVDTFMWRIRTQTPAVLMPKFAPWIISGNTGYLFTLHLWSIGTLLIWKSTEWQRSSLILRLVWWRLDMSTFSPLLALSEKKTYRSPVDIPPPPPPPPPTHTHIKKWCMASFVIILNGLLNRQSSCANFGSFRLEIDSFECLIAQIYFNLCCIFLYHDVFVQGAQPISKNLFLKMTIESSGDLLSKFQGDMHTFLTRPLDLAFEYDVIDGT